MNEAETRAEHIDHHPPKRYLTGVAADETFLAWVKPGEAAIPDIQRPFVRNAAKVGKLNALKIKAWFERV